MKNLSNRKIYIILVIALAIPTIGIYMLSQTGDVAQGGITYGRSWNMNRGGGNNAFAPQGAQSDFTTDYTDITISHNITAPTYSSKSAVGLQGSSAVSGSRSILGNGLGNAARVSNGGMTINGGSSAASYGRSKESVHGGATAAASGFMALSSTQLDAPFSDAAPMDESMTRLDGGPDIPASPPTSLGSVLCLLFLALPYVGIKRMRKLNSIK